jgi:hypothetical protein
VSSSQANVRVFEELRAREEALEAKVASLQDALHESEAQRASLKRAAPSAYLKITLPPPPQAKLSQSQSQLPAAKVTRLSSKLMR